MAKQVIFQPLPFDCTKARFEPRRHDGLDQAMIDESEYHALRYIICCDCIGIDLFKYRFHSHLGYIGLFAFTD